MFQKLKDIKALLKIVSYWDNIRKEMEGMKNIGSLLTSKRLWVNLAGLLVTFGDILPPKQSMVVVAVANTLTKLIDMGIFTKSDPGTP